MDQAEQAQLARSLTASKLSKIGLRFVTLLNLSDRPFLPWHARIDTGVVMRVSKHSSLAPVSKPMRGGAVSGPPASVRRIAARFSRFSKIRPPSLNECQLSVNTTFWPK